MSSRPLPKSSPPFDSSPLKTFTQNAGNILIHVAGEQFFKFRAPLFESEFCQVLLELGGTHAGNRKAERSIRAR